MRVRFWGTRGSIATPGAGTVRYGGNTSCIEVRSAAGTLVVIDCGTGARGLSDALIQSGRAPLRGHVLISHTHWDHIQGLPFFRPLFAPDNEWDIYAPHGLEQSLQETLAGQMQHTYFPVSLHELGAQIRYHEIVEGTFALDDIQVKTQFLNHPALTLGYRLEADGVSLVYSCDHEPHSRQLASGTGDVEGHDLRHAAFMAGADLLIHDAQYTAAEYENRKGWGHSTGEYAIAVARRAGVRRLALTHHDPAHDDGAIDRMVDGLRAFAAANLPAMEIFAAAEGLSVELTPAASTPAAMPDKATADKSAAAPTALVMRSVLLGFSDPAAATEMQEAASAEGIEVGLESDAVHLISRAIAESPTVIIVDRDLPGMSDAAIRALRASARDACAPTPVIGVTDREDDAAKGEDGITDWLVRPFSVSYARARIRAWLLRTPFQWVRAPTPADESRRLAALRSLGILDTPQEERFDRLTRVAAAIFDVPTALVSLIDSNRQWFKSAYGTAERETTRETSFCAHAVAARATLVVPDTLRDSRFADNPMVTGGPRVRFYAGEPLILADGSCVGTLCILDTRPRALGVPELGLLRDIAELVRRELMLSAASPVAASSLAAFKSSP